MYVIENFVACVEHIKICSFNFLSVNIFRFLVERNTDMYCAGNNTGPVASYYEIRGVMLFLWGIGARQPNPPARYYFQDNMYNLHTVNYAYIMWFRSSTKEIMSMSHTAVAEGWGFSLYQSKLPFYKNKSSLYQNKVLREEFVNPERNMYRFMNYNAYVSK